MKDSPICDASELFVSGTLIIKLNRKLEDKLHNITLLLDTVHILKCKWLMFCHQFRKYP